MAMTARLGDFFPDDLAVCNGRHDTVSCGAHDIAPADRAFLLLLERRALEYFLHNQVSSGLVLDRQRNHNSIRSGGLCSIAATGMGFLAFALASAPPHRLLSRRAAVQRIRTGLRTVLNELPNVHGVLPHFVDSVTGDLYGVDRFSTVDSSWLFAGALWAAEFLGDAELEDLARSVYARVDWNYWTAPDSDGQPGLLRHGMDANGGFLPCCWDRLNGETVFMYVLAAGAEETKAMHPQAWQSLRPFHGTVAGLRFNNADLGLFVFQYGLDLLDLEQWKVPGQDLFAEARVATVANYRACREASDQFVTYRRYWGLSAGDGPGDMPNRDTYRCYAPLGQMDGTAHVMATAAAIAHIPAQVLENLREAHRDRQLEPLGRYGFSNVNRDRCWRSRDMIGIDAGAAVLALDNFLAQGRIRRVFHSLPAVRDGVNRMHWTSCTARRSLDQHSPGQHLPIRMAS